MRIILGVATLAAAASAVAAQRPPPPPVTIHHPVLPKGATMVGTSAHATILTAPPDAQAVAEARLPSRPPGGAKTHGLGEAEARRRRAEQGKLQMDFGTIVNRLRREQPGNFVGAMIRHEPHWDYVFFFKGDPVGTLARYTGESRFKAEAARFSESDRERLIEPWNKRWRADGIPFAYGLDAVYQTMDVQLGITEREYRSLAAARGWGEPPAPIVLKFAREPVRPALDPAIAPLLRGFAHEKYATLMQLEALGTGRLILRDGCLMVQGHDGKERVAVFHKETGIGLDRAGYMAVVDRMTGRVRGRVGEMMAWGAPNAIPDDGMVGLAGLRAACPGELVNIGNPESKAVFDARYRTRR